MNSFYFPVHYDNEDDVLRYGQTLELVVNLSFSFNSGSIEKAAFFKTQIFQGCKMSKVWRRLQRVGKTAYKFEFTIKVHTVTLECVSGW